MIVEAVQQMLASDRSATRLAVLTTEASEGRAIVRQIIEPDMANGLGVAQGGFIFALADQAFACAANSIARDIATVDANIAYVSPARVGDELIAEAVVAFADARRVVVDITVREGERVVALVRATGRAMRPV